MSVSCFLTLSRWIKHWKPSFRCIPVPTVKRSYLELGGRKGFRHHHTTSPSHRGQQQGNRAVSMKLPIPSQTGKWSLQEAKSFGITKNKLPKLHLDISQLQFTASRTSHGIISKWITMIYFWFQSSNEHNLPVEWEEKRLGASHIPPAPFQSHNFHAGRHPPTDGQWTCHERGRELWVLVSLESMTLEIRPSTGFTLY